MRTPLLALVLGSLAPWAGCATVPHNARIVDDRPLVTAGSRCQGSTCTCREVDAFGATVGEAPSDPSDVNASTEGAVAKGQKRYELRTGRGSDTVDITIEGRGTLHKSAEPVTPVCGYIDLPPGNHRVHVHVEGDPSVGGASPKILFYEHGERAKSWYATFGITCGETGPCTDGDLHERMAHLERSHGLFDRCGSTKVRDIHWDSHKGADERVTSMDLDFTLQIYDFAPRFARGGTCKGPSLD
ncbi:MAG: hypothetical protein ABI321_23605 [Polyangia bacterium]